MIPEIKNIVFDLGGVLVDLDIDRCRTAFLRLGMPRVAELISPYYPAEMIGQLERGDISFGEACDRMRRLDNRPDITDREIKAAYGDFVAGVSLWKLHLVERLRRRGLRTFVLSNNNPATMAIIRRLFAADGRTMEDYFDGIYLSYRLRCLKPSTGIFRLMIDDSGIRPEETLLIDDGLRNTEAARALGFRTHLLAPNEDLGSLFE